MGDRKLLEYEPEYAEAHFNYGTLLFGMGSLVSRPHAATSCIHKGLIKDKAEAELKEALRLRPDHSGAANNLKVGWHTVTFTAD